mmetsp:Transcript_93436/g.213664  ORF Transcript_93436/g.213664 Transcript_93436/m.213664 type:complete len:202 (+) Transcript_93436:697-1302(+)
MHQPWRVRQRDLSRPHKYIPLKNLQHQPGPNQPSKIKAKNLAPLHPLIGRQSSRGADGLGGAGCAQAGSRVAPAGGGIRVSQLSAEHNQHQLPAQTRRRCRAAQHAVWQPLAKRDHLLGDASQPRVLPGMPPGRGRGIQMKAPLEGAGKLLPKLLTVANLPQKLGHFIRGRRPRPGPRIPRTHMSRTMAHGGITEPWLTVA